MVRRDRVDAPSVRLAGPADLPLCLAIRRAVFIDGLGIPESVVVDGLDPGCAHFLAHVGGSAVGTARMRPVAGAAKAERVAVLDARRGRGIGRALMQALEDEAAARGLARVELHAQQPVVPFYERLGYRAEGPTFVEASIPHQAMWKALRP
jgi:predicted GNAT family N-acyltransferase